MNVTDKLKKLLMGLAALGALAAGGSAIAGATSSGKPAEQAAGTEAAEGSEQGEAPGTETADKEDKGEEADKALTGADAQRAKDAALTKTGGGTVGDVESDTENGGTYAVEVTKADGSKVDVRLDEAFKVLGVEAANHGDQDGDKNDQADGPETGSDD